MRRSDLTLRALVFLASIHACSAGWAAPAGVPDGLEVSVGGFFGPSYTLQLNSGAVVCIESQGGSQVSKLQASVSPAQWDALRAELDRLRVWTWRPRYDNFGAVDGTQWTARITYPDRSLASSGSNRYPNADGSASSSHEETVVFGQFRAALAKLVPRCKL